MRRIREPKTTPLVSAISAAVLLAALPGAASAAVRPPGQGSDTRTAMAPVDYDETACEGPPAEEGDPYGLPKTSPNSTPPRGSKDAPHKPAPGADAGRTVPGSGPSGAATSRNALPSTWPRGIPDQDEAERMLDGLPVRAFDDKGYDHKHFVGKSCWLLHGPNRCTTRQIALREASRTPVKHDGPCRVVGGEWRSEYEYKGRTMADPLRLDVDHLVPLRNAWGSGANRWSFQKRREFANDLLATPELIVVSTWTNRAKGDKGPERWMPKGSECTYARAWVAVKDYYRLSVTEAERAALYKALDHCPDTATG
ncbi:HNH endonuclease family protein [Streptomyces sp. NPDC046261]|uniref:HNH endonuclease family protein n=1 Tax=Streptomyces sp. NPDC046261 TaxID=3157200 RepID=UPI0034012FF2